MATTKTITLITGANSGIGLEIAAQLLADASKHVLLGCRSAEKGEAAMTDLTSRNLPGSVEFLHLDVSDPTSIEAAAKTVEAKHGKLDALINNAGIASPTPANSILNEIAFNGSQATFPLSPLASQMALCFQANATGPLLLSEALSPLLSKTTTNHPRIISVSSGAGSISKRLTPSNGGAASKIRAPWYYASKAAMNMVAAEQVVQFGGKGFKIFTYCPGFTVSNLGPFNKAENGAKPTSEGARPVVRMVNGECDELHGKFVHEDGGKLGEYPW